MAPRPADTYAGYHPLKRTYRLPVPASRVLYVPEARGGLPPGPHVLYAPGMRFPPRNRTYRAPWQRRFRHGTVRCLAPIYRAPWHRRFLATYDAYPSYIQRCDAARYFIIYTHGGLYADLDYECTKPFAPVLADARAVFSHKQAIPNPNPNPNLNPNPDPDPDRDPEHIFRLAQQFGQRDSARPGPPYP